MRQKTILLLSGFLRAVGYGRQREQKKQVTKTLTNIIFIAFSMLYHFVRHRLEIDSNGINITFLF